VSSILSAEWPRCVICSQIITKGFNKDRVRNIVSDPDGKNPRHIFEKDCLLSPVVFNKEEVDIVY
jgi:hypothetical protein